MADERDKLHEGRPDIEENQGKSLEVITFL